MIYPVKDINSYSWKYIVFSDYVKVFYLFSCKDFVFFSRKH